MHEARSQRNIIEAFDEYIILPEPDRQLRCIMRCKISKEKIGFG